MNVNKRYQDDLPRKLRYDSYTYQGRRKQVYTYISIDKGT